MRRFRVRVCAAVSDLPHAVCQLRLRSVFRARAVGVLAARQAPGRALAVAARFQLLLLLREREAPLRALADATRRDSVRRTLAGEASVSELAAAYDMSWAAVQNHVSVLEGAELVTKEARGRERIVRGNPSQIQRAQALLDSYEQIWRARIDRLDALLAEDTATN